MDKIIEFKEFVKRNPNLLKFVKNNEMTWQKFYEMYDIYGPDNSVWSDYKDEKNVIGLADIVTWIKNIDLESIHENLESISRVVSVLQDLSGKNNESEYKPRPIYKHFED